MRASSLVRLHPLVMLVCLGVVCFSCMQGALAGPASREQQMAEAQEHFSRGAQLYDQERYQGAWEEFARAYQLSRLPEMLFNLARTEDRLGRTRDAIRHLDEYLQFPDVKDREEVRDYVERLRPQDPPEPPPVALLDEVQTPPTITEKAIGKAPRKPPPPLRVAKWVVGAVGVIGIAVGAALMGVGGADKCGPDPLLCHIAVATYGGGAGTTTAGLLTVGLSGLFFALDHRQKDPDTRLPMMPVLSVTGRF